MNDTIYLDPICDDDERRERLFQGQLFVYSARASSLAFVQFARKLVENTFAPHDPGSAQHALPVEQYAELLTRMKLGFIHDPESKRHIQYLLAELGCDLTKTYFDLPKLRSCTSDGYLTTGIAYAWHPHRDTWYSAPACQINYWIPIYPISSDNAMAFHPRYFNEAVSNTSSEYNYSRWNEEHRGGHVGTFLKSDPRPLPRPTQSIEMDPQIRLVIPPGSVLMFSAQQMHSSVPNTSGVTRFSLDFRTVNTDDAAARRGAPLVDANCTGTTMRDYLRGSDLAHVPDDIVRMYGDETVGHGVLLHQPTNT